MCRAIGVVLSGTGSDGRVGIESIKSAGGFVPVQDPTTARFDGMPLSAVATGLVDAVLSPEEMPGELRRRLTPAGARPLLDIADAGEALDRIHAALGVASGIDFSEYKSRPSGTASAPPSSACARRGARASSRSASCHGGPPATARQAFSLASSMPIRGVSSMRPPLCALLGYTHRQLVGRDRDDLMVPDHAVVKVAQAVKAKAERRRNACYAICALETPTGVALWLSCRALTALVLPGL